MKIKGVSEVTRLINLPNNLPRSMHLNSSLTFCSGSEGANPPGQGQRRRPDGAGGEQVRPRGRASGGQGPGDEHGQAVRPVLLHGDVSKGEDRSYRCKYNLE